MKTVDELLEEVKRVHFIGIGGSGMCPLAEILFSKGYAISGSDNNESDNLKKLRAMGIPVYMGQRAENLEGAELVIYTAALLPDNPELVASREAGLPTFERSKLFGAVTRKYGDVVGVCGTHGKTTTTAMITQIFLDACRDPSAVIGGRLPSIDAHGRVGDADLLVVEACEFARTFLELSVSTAVLLNVDADHLDVYKTMDNLIAAFGEFCAGARDNVVFNGDDAKSVKALSAVKDKKIVSFGLSEENDYYAANIGANERACPEFALYRRGELLGTVSLGIPGRHNVYNALAALAVADIYGVPFESAADSLRTFHGADRRFQIKGKYNGAVLADDYAHHPAELKATLEAAKEMGYRRVVAVFQPFTFSRTYLLIDDFAEALDIADEVVLTPIMAGREVNTYNIHTSDLTARIPGAKEFRSFSQIRDYLTSSVGEGDLVLTLGCGDVYKIEDMILAG